MDTISDTTGDVFELQVWDGKLWNLCRMGSLKDVSYAYGLTCGVPRRIVRTDKHHAVTAPKKHSIAFRDHASYRSRDQVQQDYFKWASDNGVKQVTAYSNCPLSGNQYNAQIRYVDKAEFLGPAPTAEIEN